MKSELRLYCENQRIEILANHQRFSLNSSIHNYTIDSNNYQKLQDLVKFLAPQRFDTEKMVLDVGREMLEHLGFTVHTAVNGQEAVDKIHSNEVDFCAAVLDISMPEMDGIEAMRAIRKSNPSLPILLSSGYSEVDFPFEEDEENKPEGFLGKPFQLSDMRSSLEKFLYP